MKDSTFPFYRGELAVASSIFQLVKLKTIRDYSREWTFSNKKCRPEIDIYKTFVETLKEKLNDDFFVNTVKLYEDIFKNGSFQIDPKSGKDIGQVIIRIKNSLLEHFLPDTEDIDLLHGYLFTEEDEDHDRCIPLLRWLGFDLETIEACFLKANSIKNGHKIKECFYAIAIHGARGFAYYTIKALGNTVSMGLVKHFRENIERFCIFIELISQARTSYENRSSGFIILNLMEAAYLDGKIVRETEMYLDGSRKAMSSHGQRYTRNASQKATDEIADQAKEFINQEYINGSNLSVEEMKDLIKSIEPFKELSDDRVRTVTRNVRRNHGIDGRKNNRFLKANNKSKNKN